MTKTAEEITVECPAPTYRFRVNIGAEQCWAGTVSGLDNMSGGYRDGMGGLSQHADGARPLSVTLSQLRIAANTRLSEWFGLQPGTADKRDITINLMGEKDNELFMTWAVMNAVPSAVSGIEWDATRSEMVISQVVLQCERVTMTAH